MIHLYKLLVTVAKSWFKSGHVLTLRTCVQTEDVKISIVTAPSSNAWVEKREPQVFWKRLYE